MRSVHGTFATLLLMVPVLSIPALAIFGIPQIAPVVASPLDEGDRLDRERRVGQSARPGDNFNELDDASSFGHEPSDSGSTFPPGRIGDSVPLTRPDRQARDQRMADVDTRIQKPSAPRPKTGWLDDVTDDRRPRGLDDSPNRSEDSRGVDPQGSVDQQGSVDRRRSPSETHGPGPVNPGQGFGTQDPRAFQRRRDAQPQSGNSEPDAVASSPLTWQTAVRRLNEMEIRNFRLQPGHRDNQFVFICSYTPSDSPRVSYRFEAEADEPLKAVEKVLEQILEWQQRR